MLSQAYSRLAILLCLVLFIFTTSKLNATNLIEENFQNWTKVGSWATSGTQAIPAGTVTLNNYVVYNTQVVAGTGSNGGVYIRSGNGVMQLPAISSCGTVEIRTGTSGTGQATMKLQISSNGTDWTDAVALITSPTNGTPTTTQTFVINQSTTTYLKFVAINLNTMIFDLIVSDYVVSGAPSPALTATTGATVDAPFNVSFTDDAAWRTAITSIMVGAATLDPSAYSVSAGTISFTPSASALLQSAGAKSITVKATGYIDALVSQTIEAGAATQLVVQTQPTAPAGSGLLLAVQPIVKIADQYGNTSSSTATVTASVNGSEAWVLGGTLTSSAVAGLATFTDLTATNEFTGASITFTSGAWSVNSSTFNIPPAISYSTAFINPGFEDAMGTEWTIQGTTIITDGANVYAGAKAAHMNANNQMYQIVNLEPNTMYDISCYAKVGAEGQSTLLGITEYVGNVFVKNTPITSTTYQKYTISFTTSSAVQYKVWGWTGAAGDYYFDNFELAKSTTTALNNPAANDVVSIMNNQLENELRINVLEKGVANINVFDIQGRKVYTSTTSNSVVTINKNDIGNKGMYIVDVRINDKKVVTKIVL